MSNPKDHNGPGSTEFRAKIAQLGSGLNPDILKASRALFAPFHEAEPYEGVEVRRDISFGSDERHRLDVFLPDDAPASAAILLFVHGGGFVGGDKKTPGQPFQDNVALWAARHGMIGINMTYRLAPDHVWPSASDDVADALNWIRKNFAGDGPARPVFLMGTSSGAAHVATHIARSGASAQSLAGVILLSGIYDLCTGQLSANVQSYYGTDPATYASRSSLNALLQSKVPLMIAIGEFEPVFFEQQALNLMSAHAKQHEKWPHFIRLMGHNHFTATLQLNSSDETLGRELYHFIATNIKANS